MKIKALIPVRSGSVRVGNKNIRPFAGSTLLDIKIQQLQKVKELDGIVVNSNDDEILKVASNYNVELFKREEKYASNTISMSDVYKNMAENIDADAIMYTNVTNPLILPETIEKMIQLFKKGGDFDSINSANAVKEFMFLDNKPINYDLFNQPRSQDLPNILALNFAISLLSREVMISQSNVVGRNPYLYEISEVEGIDIDTPLDFFTAEQVYIRKYIEQNNLV